MNKVKLTIIKDSPAALQLGPTVIIQQVYCKAKDCSHFVVDNSPTESFMFGSSVVCTHGVQAFIFEDVEETSESTKEDEEFTRDTSTLIFSDKWYIEIPRDTKLTNEVLEAYQDSLRALDTGKQSSICLPVDWKLIPK